MMSFVHESRFPAEPGKVFAFHERDDIFEILVPPWQKVKVVSRSGGLRVGARVEFRLLFGPFHLTWVALHTEYERNRLFVDKQVRGPFAFWLHRHIFQPDGDGCLLRDEIAYSLPFGLDPILGSLVQKDLRRMFAYRHEMTAKYLGIA